jgi:hypothetical protein
MCPKLDLRFGDTGYRRRRRRSVGVAAFNTARVSLYGSAVRTRERNGGRVDSPLLWAEGTAPPTGGSASDLQSETGSDLFVETDCASVGCQAAGTEPHLLVYSAACATAGPWFDTVTGRCRGQ